MFQNLVLKHFTIEFKSRKHFFLSNYIQILWYFRKKDGSLFAQFQWSIRRVFFAMKYIIEQYSNATIYV
jgi:hypothetical protein